MRTTKDKRQKRGLQESASSGLFTAVRAAEGREFRIDFGGHVCVQLALNLDSNDCRVRATQAIRGSLRISVFDSPSGPGRRISKEDTIKDVLKLLDF